MKNIIPLSKLFFSAVLFISGNAIAQIEINTETPATTLHVQGQRQNADISDRILAPKVGKLELHTKSSAAYGQNQIGSVVYVDELDATTTFKPDTHPKVKK